MRSRPSPTDAAVAGALLTILSCGGGEPSGPPPGPPPPPPTATVPARITLEPEAVAVVQGDTVRVKATVLNDRAQPISGAAVRWASTDPATATVDATGLVVGLREGNASLSATSGPASATAPLAVHSPDRAALMDLYEDTFGPDWTRKEHWGSDEPVGSWYGVTADANSRVTALNLSGNNLKGQLPADLGDMEFLTELIVDGNAELEGPIPFSLSELSIRRLRYGGTMLCTLRDEGFRAWLNAIPTRDGEFVACNEERSDLMKLHEAMGGNRWLRSDNWGTDAPLGNWYGISVDDSTGRVISINLNRNNLSGEIPAEIRHFPHLDTLRLDYNNLEGEVPAEIGELTELKRMDIDGNNFTGPIPPEFGNLANIEELWIGANRMTGPIPPEMGNLASLEILHIYEARFDGTIPEEFGELAELRLLRIEETGIGGPLPAALGALEKLRDLQLVANELTGPLPGELGQIDSLEAIVVNGNLLSGALPPELGDAGALEVLRLQHNPGLSGPLPERMTELENLFELIAEGTGLCMPRTPAFRTWLESALPKHRIRSCGAESHAEAYLTQAVQSREFPVPLVAGEEALLRVFVTSERETGAMIPPVRATFFVDGAEVHVEDIPAGSSVIPTEEREGELDRSANAVIPAEVIRPGLEMVVEIDPDGTLDSSLGVSKRIPERGRAAVDVKVVPPMLLTLIPFVLADNDRAAATFVSTADPDDEFFWLVDYLLPIGDLTITRHEAVTVDTDDIREIVADVRRMRILEEGVGHWMGIIPRVLGGIGGIAGRSSRVPSRSDTLLYRARTSVSTINPWTVAHELGHNLSLQHALCRGDEARSDPSYPYDNGRIGVWGYDPRDRGSLVDPNQTVRDVMTYCHDDKWISDYYFANALRYRLLDPLEVRGTPARVLLVSGGVAADGTPHLDPAFVVDAPPLLPRASGPYAMTGRRADGGELFSLSFELPAFWDGDGSSGFTFALPVEPSWATELAALSLSGPGGSVEIAEGSAPPMAILRDSRTGQVRAILRELPAGPLARGAAEDLAPEPGLEVMVSSGLPGPEAWRR